MLQDKWGETGQPDGFLSQLDSQQLLTWDNLTAPGAFASTEQTRELLKMRYFDGQRCEEVAASLNTKLDAIYKRLSRLHQALKFCIETKLTQAPS